jgi:CO/xanthine dehydrogenase FAD-binding subunit
MSIRYLRPESLDEALSVLGEFGGLAKPIAGGQSLIPLMNLRLAAPDVLVDIGRLDGLSFVAEDERGLAIGALTKHHALATTSFGSGFRVIPELARQIGHLPIRFLGTFGGSVAHADPAADLPLLVQSLDAEIVVRSVSSLRVIPATEFFDMPFVTALEDDELLVEARFPAPPPGRVLTSFRKFTQHAGDFAIVSILVRLVLGDTGEVLQARVGLGGVGGTPLRVTDAEAVLLAPDRWREPAQAAVDAALAAVTPPTDVRASSGFRTHVLGALLTRAVQDLLVQSREPA